MKGRFFPLIFFSLLAARVFSQGVPISPFIMGQSYHFTDWNSPKTNSITIFGVTGNYTNFPSVAAWPKVTESGAKLVRIGGNQYNIGSEKPQAGQEIYYVSIIDDIRKNGCEPVLTLPFLLNTNTLSGIPEPTTGATYQNTITNSVDNALKILNMVNTVHKRGVKYVIIANEPDLDYSYTNDSWLLTSTVSVSNYDAALAIAGYVKAIAQAVKEFDPSIKIIGPELSYYKTKIYNYLFSTSFSNPECIAGNIPSGPAAGNPYIDFASVHVYLHRFTDAPDIAPAPPFSTPSYNNSFSSASDWENFMAFTDIERYGKQRDEVQNAPDAPKRFKGTLRDLRQKCQQVTTARGTNKPLGFMITEMNCSLKNTTSSSNDPGGKDARSMLGAQSLARMYALSMEYGAAACMMWSVKEGGGGNWQEDRGYLAESNGAKRGTWFHFKMLADYFKGTYYRDEILASAIGSDVSADPNPDWLHWHNSSSAGSLSVAANYTAAITATLETKAFAAKGQYIVVMILNHSGSTQSAAIRFDASGTFTTTGVAKNFRFAMSQNKELAFNSSGAYAPFDANSTTVLILDCAANAVQQRYVYRAVNEATAYGTPFTRTFGASDPVLASAAPSSTSACLGSSITINVSNAPGGSSYIWMRMPSTTTLANQLSSSLSTGTTGLFVAKITPPGGCSPFSVSACIFRFSAC